MRKLAIFAALLTLAGCFKTAPPRRVTVQEGDELPPFDVVRHLRARHPELFELERFDQWSGKGAQIGTWSERTLESSDDVPALVAVYIENAARSSLFAAKVDYRAAVRPVVTQIHLFDLLELPVTRNDVDRIVREAFPAATIQSIAPIVTFESGTLIWRAQIDEAALRLVDVDQTGKITVVPAAVVPPSSAARVAGDDSLTENDLHHFVVMKDLAEKWIRDAGIGAGAITRRARLICRKVNQLIDYSCQNKALCKFTWSDERIAATVDPQTKKFAGACDEYAVLAVTALRAVNIRARLKLLRWRVGANEFAHAAVEFVDEQGKWIPLDPTYDRFNEAKSYRTKDKVKDVIVVDAVFPDDEVSQADIDGIADRDGDGILHPYFDFQAPLVFVSQKPYSK